MTPVAHQAAKDFAPATPAAEAAASRFINAVREWTPRQQSSLRELTSFVEENVGLRPRGILSRDAMNMSVFGLMFDKAPGAGFHAVPSTVAEDLHGQALAGAGYFPDSAHPLGKAVLERLNIVSRTAEQRPLLTGVAGVAPAGVEGTRLVLTRAAESSSGLVIKAAAGAVAPTAEVRQIAASQPVKAPRAEVSHTSTARRPSPK